jgi:capsular polysaccharide biosynthesis protein
MANNSRYPFSYSRASDMPLRSLAEVLSSNQDVCGLLALGSPPITAPPRIWPSESLATPPTRTPGPVYLRSLAKVEVYGPNLLLRNGTLVSPEDTEPFYVADHTQNGWLTNYQGFPEYTADLPGRDVPVAFFVSHFNQSVYGHFLLEIVPKLFHIQALRLAGIEIPIVLSNQAASWIAPIIRTVCPGIEILEFNPKVEVLRIKKCLLISNCFTLNYYLHNQTVSDFRLFAAGARKKCPTAPSPARIFVLRDNPKSFRYMTNLRQVRDICESYGFTVIDPAKYSWIEQAAIFSTAEIVVGEFTSALHNTVFSPPGTAVLCLFWLGHLQEDLCASFGQPIGYVLSRDKRAMVYDPDDKDRKRFDFEIDTDDLKIRLRQLVVK